jgi:putative membrane protein
MDSQLPYCGAAPSPATLLLRFNLDPVLIAVLVLVALFIAQAKRDHHRTALAGLAIVTVALVSPLCALSVSLFSARVGQHMLLILGAAPLLALSLPSVPEPRRAVWLWGSVLGFFGALWFWHMPRPYDLTFDSTVAYWLMHLTLFGSAVALWRSLLGTGRGTRIDVVVAGALTSMQMGFLGAVLAFASRPFYFWHLTTTQPWGLTPLEDQQLGGVFMWVPGILLFLWAALRALITIRAYATTAETA